MVTGSESLLLHVLADLGGFLYFRSMMPVAGSAMAVLRNNENDPCHELTDLSYIIKEKLARCWY